jgi:low affinity Fe/Cu permease
MFNKFAITATQLTGSAMGFVVACLLVVAWIGTTKNLSFNDYITMLTFLMVFVIQYSQNKDTAALHLKIDELIKSSNARNDMVAIEEKSAKEIKEMKEVNY